jgi:hypothetical protein
MGDGKRQVPRRLAVGGKAKPRILPPIVTQEGTQRTTPDLDRRHMVAVQKGIQAAEALALGEVGSDVPDDHNFEKKRDHHTRQNLRVAEPHKQFGVKVRVVD